MTLYEATGREVPLAPQQRRLLAVLVAADGATVSADRLAEHVTDGRVDGSVLRTAVSRLRRVLGRRVQTTAAGYRLVLAPSELDAAEFTQVVRRARAGTAGSRISGLEAALALWRGPAFEGMADEPWAVATAGRLEEERSCAVEELAEALTANGQHPDVIAVARGLISRHPHRERPVGILMRSLAAMGRRTEGLEAYQRLRVALRDDVGLEPSIALRQLEAELLDGAGTTLQPLAAPPLPVGNLRMSPDTFIGRTRELKQLVDGLPARRLLTLVGPGGVGKTRLALHMAVAAELDFADGVWVVELASVSDRDGVLHRAASVLAAVADSSASVLQTVVDVLHGRQALVVIDNAEHVRAAAAELASAIADASDDVRVLVTSREPLDLRGEHVHIVAPLDGFESVDLFCERAREADDSFEVDDEDLVRVGTICARLDGLPLAIEIAAARTRALTIGDLLGQLDQQFDRHPSASVVDGRHATLHATIDWSYQLLTAAERDVLVCAAVFAGGFDLAAISAVSDGVIPVGTDVADVIVTLVDKSMVVADRRGRTVRFRLLESVRQFGDDQLHARGVADRVRGRHLAHYAEVSGQVAQLRGTDVVAAAALLEREWDNLRAALFWGVAHDDLDRSTGIVAWSSLALSLCRQEHSRWAAAVLEAAPPGYRWAPLLHSLVGWWSNLLGDHAEALRCAARGLALVGEGSARERRMLQTVVAEALVHLGRPEDALAASDEVIALSRTPEESCDGLMLACWSAWGCRPDLVAGYAERLGTIARSSGHRELLHQAAYTGGIVALIEGEPRAAMTYFREALGWATGMRMLEFEALQGLTMAAAAANDEETAPTFRHALEMLYVERAWAHLWMVIEGLAIHLADAGRLDEAALLLAALDTYGRASVFLVPGRRRARSTVEGVPSVAPSVASGRSMSRDRVVEAAIAFVSA